MGTSLPSSPPPSPELRRDKKAATGQAKSEIRNKHPPSPPPSPRFRRDKKAAAGQANFKIQMFKTGLTAPEWGFGFWSLVFWNCFGFIWILLSSSRLTGCYSYENHVSEMLIRETETAISAWINCNYYKSSSFHPPTKVFNIFTSSMVLRKRT